jgi:hypothetical protein
MPDRAIIPLLPAVSLGFLCGIIVSVLMLESGPSLLVGVAGGVLTALAGLSSVFGVRGDGGEKAVVAGLRAVTAVALFACVYLFMLGFLRDASIAAIIWVPLAVACGLLLSRFRVRDREPVRSDAETA